MTPILCDKSLAEVLTIRFPENRSWWLQATIIEDRGYLAIASSHGDYQHTWSSPGGPFKEFLTRLDKSYLMCKFGQMDWFDGDRTKKELLAKIREARRNEYIEADEAREFYDNAESLDYSSEYAYCHEIDSISCTDLVKRVFDGDIISVPVCKDYNPQLQTFVRELWPGLIQALTSR